MKTFFTLAIILFVRQVNAQVLIKGLVRSNNAPVALGNVILSNREGKLITGATTKHNGSFELKAGPGAYRLMISYLGLAGWEKLILLEKDTDLGLISLQADTSNLKEIGVTAKRKLIEYRPDRLVLHVENSISAAGGNAFSAIAVVPGVMMQQHIISIIGKGAARIMIDGRMLELTGEDLTALLKSIPAEDIKSIEVITAPPAKYEAGGDGGLINILLKKGVKNSWKNSVGLAYDQTSYGAYTLSNTFLYNKNRIRFSLSAGDKMGYSKVLQSLITWYPGGPWALNYAGRQKEDNVSGRFALDYDLSDKTTAGFQYLASAAWPGSRDNVKVQIYNANKGLDSLLINTGNRDLRNSSHTFNAHVLTRLDSAGKNLSFDVDYFRYHSDIDNSFVASSFLPDMHFLGVNQAARNISGQHIENASVKADMEYPLKFLNLSYGAKISFTGSRGEIAYYNTATGTPVPDPGRSNTFMYKENNQAIYVNAARTVHNNLSLQAGMRLERTQTKGYSGTLRQTTRNNYLKLFPTFYASYKQIYLFSYSRRINRPGFALLNPFRSYINSTSYSEGNPFLQPSFNDNFEFTYVYKGALRSSLFFNIISNGFGPVFTSDPGTNTLAITRQNYFKEYYYGIGENYSGNLASWWETRLSLYLTRSESKFDGSVNATPRNGFQLYALASNTFILSRSTRLQVDYMYSSPFNRGLYAFGTRSGLNVGIRQNLLKNNLQVSLLVNDVFNTAYLRDYTSVVNGIKQVYNENNSSRFLRLSLSYRFGNDRINVKQRSFGNADEIKRLD